MEGATPSRRATSATVISGILQQGLGGGQVLGLQGRGPTAGAATGPGRLQAGQGALADHPTLELGERGEEVEHQLAAGGGGVDRLGERAQAEAAHPEILDGLDQLLQGTGEAIQLPDHQRVALAHVRQGRLEGGSLALGAGRLLLADLLAAGGPQRVELQGQILLLGSRPWRSRPALHPPETQQEATFRIVTFKAWFWDKVGPAIPGRAGERAAFRKRPDTVGEVGRYAASAAKREVRVGASGRPANHAARRSRLMAAAAATFCRPALASPR